MTPKLASGLKLTDLVGRKVRALREFSGIAPGTIGIVVSTYDIGKKHSGIMVRWGENPNRTAIQDGFGRDADFDETQWLEVVE